MSPQGQGCGSGSGIFWVDPIFADPKTSYNLKLGIFFAFDLCNISNNLGGFYSGQVRSGSGAGFFRGSESDPVFSCGSDLDPVNARPDSQPWTGPHGSKFMVVEMDR